MPLTITRSIADDATAVTAVQVAAFHDDARMYPGRPLDGPPGYDSVEVTLRKIEQDDCYTIWMDARIVGFLCVFNQGDGHYHLDIISVDPTLHGKGIGSQAMRFIHAQYPARLWTLDTPAYALRNQHFYGKFGYVKVGEWNADSVLLLYAYEMRPDDPKPMATASTLPTTD
jgi:ribosomal protein S18 acetylase RimI-like enzyme